MTKLRSPFGEASHNSHGGIQNTRESFGMGVSPGDDKLVVSHEKEVNFVVMLDAKLAQIRREGRHNH